MFTKAIQWIKHHSIPGEGISVSSRQRLSYPEVTGYLIPTLYHCGEPDLARAFARWLVTIQKTDGSFPAPGDHHSFAFDTGQVLRGWVAAMADIPELEQPLWKACNWLVTQSTPAGRLPRPQLDAAWSLGERGAISEGVHLYALPPLLQAGEILGEPRFSKFAYTSLNYYLRNFELSEFRQVNMLTHLFAYIQEALFDLGVPEAAQQGMQSLAAFQQPTGAIPAYFDVNWVCTPGQLQSAIVWHKLGETERAGQALAFMENFSNPSGGFFGSYGVMADYFQAEEISWAVKFYLDALLISQPHLSAKVQTAPPQPQQSSPSKGVTAVADATQTGNLNDNMQPDEWHGAIVGAHTPAEVAATVLNGAMPVWIKPILAHTASSQHVLELGSGTGQLSAFLAKMGRQVTLLDFSASSLGFTRQLFTILGFRADFVQADVLQTLDFPDKHFDCVWSSGLLEHFSDEQIVQILGESARVCRGKVISLVPNANSTPYRLGKWLQEQSGVWKWGRETPKPSLRWHFERAGLTVLSEYSIAPEHAVEFLALDDTLKQLWQTWYASLSSDELEQLNQGYLLVTVGQVPTNGNLSDIHQDNQTAVHGNNSLGGPSPRLGRLAIVPNDPLQAYVEAGYPDLTEYFNPLNCFEEVYCLSPFESVEQVLYGMKVIPTSPEKFAQRLRELQIDAVRAYDVIAGRYACAQKVADIPYVVSIHDVNPDRLPEGHLPDADYFLAISQAVEKFLLERGADPTRIVRFANRVDLDVFQPSRDLSRRQAFAQRFPGRYRLLHVGRKDPQKNLDTLINALKLLGPDYVALFVGRGDAAPYQELARRAGVLDQCYFVDSVANAALAEYYSFCDCMCTPSRWEGFGIVFIEALACAAIVVTADVAPMNEYITHGVNGLLVQEFENPAALAESIRLACTDSELQASLRARARQAAQPFSKAAVDRREVEIYQSLLAEHKRRYLPSSGATGGPAVLRKPRYEAVALQPNLRAEWESLVQTSPDAWFYHAYDEQLLLLEAYPAKHFNFLVYEADQIRAVCPLQWNPGSPFIDSTLMGPAGPAFAPELDETGRAQVMQFIVDYCKALLVDLRPYGGRTLRLFIPPLAPRSLDTRHSEMNPLTQFGFRDVSTQTKIIHLQQTEEEIFKGFSKGHRSAIKRAQKYPIEIYPATTLADMQDYYKLHVETYTRTGVQPHPWAYFEAIWKFMVKPGQARCFMARLEGECIAATNIACFGNATLYWTGAYGARALETEAGKLLQWEAICWARRNGYAWHEVGEVFPEAAKDTKLAGLTRYKNGFGGELHPFYQGQLALE